MPAALPQLGKALPACRRPGRKPGAAPNCPAVFRPRGRRPPAAPAHASARTPAARPPRSTSTRLGVPKRTAEVAAALDARCAEWGGDRPIHSVLVANNGLAATKFMRSVRSWAYKNFGNERAGGWADGRVRQ